MADFKPSFPDTLTPFRFFCQRVLPAVYTDELSYYEVLCKTVNYLNKTMENVNTLNVDIQGIYNEWLEYQNELNTSFEEWKEQVDSEFQELKNYVDTYFSNLDLTSEVNAIIEKYVNDGTLERMINNQILQGIQGDVYGGVHGFFTNRGSAFSKMMKDLANPFINGKKVFIVGDSITWGMMADPLGTKEPRSGKLTDPRNITNSPSWANMVSDFIGRIGIMNPALTTSNWQGSPSGNSIRTYSGNVSNGFYPTNSEIGVNGETIQNSYARNGIVGLSGFVGQYGALVKANVTTPRNEDTYAFIKFDVDNVSTVNFALGVFYLNVSHPAEQTLVDVYLGSSYLRTYTINPQPTQRFIDLEVNFNNAYTGMVEIRIRPGEWSESASQTSDYQASIPSYKLNKTVTVYNQGIIGSTFYSMLNSCINEGGIAGADYVITQLGTNDRNKKTYADQGDGYQGVNWMLGQYDDAVKAICENRAYMVSNNCAGTSTQTFTQEQLRNMIRQFCADNSLDFVDNYQATVAFKLGDITADNLHPNNIGHRIVAANVISAICGG